MILFLRFMSVQCIILSFNSFNIDRVKFTYVFLQHLWQFTVQPLLETRYISFLGSGATIEQRKYGQNII